MTNVIGERKNMANITEQEANRLISIVVDDEYVVGQSNNAIPDGDYMDYLDMFDCERTERNYDWMSDIYFPEFLSQMLTQSAIESNLLFKTHDFVEVYIGSNDELHQRAARASRDLINTTLNRRGLHFYHKYMRAINTKNINGATYFRCWWEQETVKQKTGRTRTVIKDGGVDPEGNPIEFFDEEEIEEDIVTKDHFNFDIVDPRDIFTDNSYVYSLQEKRWIIIRFNATIDDLQGQKDEMEYFNLDKLEDLISQHETKVKGDKTTHHGLDNKVEPNRTPLKEWEIIQRLGKHWVLVDERDEDGNPIRVTSGLDENGGKKQRASLEEMVITFALNGNQRILIGYHPQRNVDSDGNTYRPIVRGLCYIHPAKDDGMGDGKCLKELQIGINDTINMENDRTKLATIPVMQGNEHDITDNESLVWEPGAFWQTESGQVLTEVQVSGDVNAALNQVSLYRGAMQQASGISSETQSQLAAPTTTATATANQAARSDNRASYRTLTMENTGLCEVYWIITQMSARHMKQDTALKMLGERNVQFFNPTLDFTYKPISASADTDSSKQAKIQNWVTILGYIINDPERRPAVDFVLNELAGLMGKEYETFGGKFLADTSAPPLPGTGGQQAQGLSVPTTNQSGLPQGQQEQQVREAANA